MANKTATLKNQAGDNIYPNIVGDNRNAAIKDSATIKHTLVDNKISLDLDEAIKGKIDAALQKPTGLTKTKLVGVGAQGQENIEIGDNLTLKDGKLAAAGDSVSPTLNLLDMSTDTPTVRTSITEEEKQNIEKGLYNQVIYNPDPSKFSGNISARLPSKIITLGDYRALTYFIADENGYVLGVANYPFTIGAKDPSTGHYPITINKDDGSALPFDVPVSVVEGEVKWITSGSIQHRTIAMKSRPSASLDKFILHYVDGSSTYTILFNRIQQITDPIKASTFFGTDGSFYYSCTSIDTNIEEIKVPAIDETTLFDKWKVAVKHIDDITPQPILPCTTADDGKVLSVVNGQAQWANAGGGGSGIPVVEGNEAELTEEEKMAGFSGKYTIPAAQTSPFILHTSEGFNIFINVVDNTYNSVLATGNDLGILYGSDTVIYTRTYTPTEIYSTKIEGYLPTDEATSVDINFPALDRIRNSICVVEDRDFTKVFLKNSDNNNLGWFQTPITCRDDGTYRCWYITSKEGDDTGTLATVKCKVINMGGSGPTTTITFED